MNRKPSEEILSSFDKMKEINFFNYNEKVYSLKKLKETYSPYWIYFFLSLIFFSLGLYLIIEMLLNNNFHGDSIRLKFFLIIFSFIVTILSFYLGKKMYKLNKIKGKDIKILKKTLSLEIKSEENRLYKLIDEKKAIIIGMIKEEFSTKEVSEDLIKIFCWYVDNEIKQKFLDGPILKKVLFCKLSKDFSC